MFALILVLSISLHYSYWLLVLSISLHYSYWLLASFTIQLVYILCAFCLYYQYNKIIFIYILSSFLILLLTITATTITAAN
jgi:hypothetical protein